MTETRGYETINDRSAGWGPGVDPGAQPIADASKEVTATRAGRLLATRKSFEESPDPAIVDRTVGYGGEFDPTGGSGDYGVGVAIGDETPVSLADPADYANGVFVDEEGDPETGTGTNTAHTENDSDFKSSARTSTKPSGALDPTIGSIVDRTYGWGHDDAAAAVELDKYTHVDDDFDNDGVSNEDDADPFDDEVQ